MRRVAGCVAVRAGRGIATGVHGARGGRFGGTAGVLRSVRRSWSGWSGVPKLKRKEKVTRIRKVRWTLFRVRDFCRARGYWPTSTELARAQPANLSEKSVALRWLRRLKAAGFLAMTKHQRWAITDDGWAWLRCAPVVAKKPYPPRRLNHGQRCLVARKKAERIALDAYAVFERRVAERSVPRERMPWESARSVAVAHVRERSADAPWAEHLPVTD